MGFLSFGKKIKNRRFDYIPRYYDADKEEFEHRMKMYKREGSDTELAKEKIKGGFRRSYRVGNSYSQEASKRSNRILLLTIVFLLLMAFYFISEYLPRIVASFE
jgi:hypothetical protein